MGTLKNKTNKQINQNGLIDAENKLVVTRRKGVGFGKKR